MVRCSPDAFEFSQSTNTTEKSDPSEHHEELIFSGYSEVGCKIEPWLNTRDWSEKYIINNIVVTILLVKDEHTEIYRLYFVNLNSSSSLCHYQVIKGSNCL